MRYPKDNKRFVTLDRVFGRAHNAGLCPSLGIDTTEKECIMVYGIKIQ